jgi:hypothetical protein
VKELGISENGSIMLDAWMLCVFNILKKCITNHTIMCTVKFSGNVEWEIHHYQKMVIKLLEKIGARVKMGG